MYLILTILRHPCTRLILGRLLCQKISFITRVSRRGFFQEIPSQGKNLDSGKKFPRDIPGITITKTVLRCFSFLTASLREFGISRKLKLWSKEFWKFRLFGISASPELGISGLLRSYFRSWSRGCPPFSGFPDLEKKIKNPPLGSLGPIFNFNEKFHSEISFEK